MHVGEAEVAALETVGEFLVIEAEEVEERGVEVVDVDFVFDDAEAEFVGRAEDGAAFTPPPASHTVNASI